MTSQKLEGVRKLPGEQGANFTRGRPDALPLCLDLPKGNSVRHDKALLETRPAQGNVVQNL